MLIRWFVVLVLCFAVGGSFAQDGQERSAHKKAPNKQQLGSEQRPLTVKVAPPEDAQARAAEDKAEREEKRASDRKIERYTGELAKHNRRGTG